MNIILTSFFLSIFAMYGYFVLARKYAIIDKPNERSSHDEIVYRGGGLVFLIGACVYYFSTFEYHFFFAGLIIISAVSFADDIINLSSKIRFIIQILAVGLLFYDVGVFSVPIIYIPMALIFAVGILNAYNFMDGINGITALYSATVLLSCYFAFKIVGIHSTLPVVLFPSLMVFSFFNIRTKARCFAGDVGAVSMAFCVIFMLILLLRQSLKYEMILFLSIYGIDSILTIIQRIYQGENIFKPHLKHLYQYLIHRMGLGHLVVAWSYAIVQTIISCVVLLNLKYEYFDDKLFTVFVLIVLIISYIFIKILLGYNYNFLLEKIILPFGDWCLGKKFIKSLKLLRWYDSLDEKQIAAIQKDKLSAMLSHAVNNSPYYRSLNIKKSNDPYEFISKFPILEKKIYGNKAMIC